MIDPKRWPDLSRLLDEALDIPREDRDRWLDSLPATDSVHREELRNLLQHDGAAETRDILNSLPNVQKAAARARAALRSLPFSSGSTVGPYVIERELGSGGMGAVWLARRSDGVIKRPVALKLPHAGPLARQLADRFESERNILSDLVHPNIARLYDAGFCENGQPYLALEYVAGAPLTSFCDEHRLNIDRRLRLFQQVLRAVQYAHGNLVIHRDLKPSNLIVDASGRVVLLDFGIAKLIAADKPEEIPRPKAEHPVALTPEYASPEQISGDPITTASDIYSLGVLLYELLTGECPYNLGHSERTALERAIRTVDPICPSRATVNDHAARARGTTRESICDTLHGDLDAIILKALKKTPADRYRTADAFSEDIERYLEGEPIAARAGGRWYRTRKFIARHRLSVAVSAVALVAVITMAAMAMSEAHVAAIHASAAAAERDRALALSSRNAAVGEFVHMFITAAARSNKPVAPGELVTRAEEIVTREFQDSPDDRAAVLDVLSGYYDTKDEYTRAEELLSQALEITRDSDDADLRRKLTCSHAAAMAKLGKVPDAVRILNTVLQDPQISTQQSARCLASLSRISQAAGDGPNALKYAQRALARLRQSSPHPPKALEADFLADIGNSDYLNGHNDLAGQHYAESIAVLTKAGLDRGLDALALRNNWALVSDGAGTPRVALELLDQVLELAALNETDALPQPVFLYNRARELEDIGRYAEARETYLRCVTVARQTKADELITVGFVGLAAVSLEVGDLSSAAGYIADASTNISAQSAPSIRALEKLRIVRGSFALEQGRIEAARADLDAAIQSGKNVYWKVRALLNRAEVNLKDNQVDAAREDAKLALALAQSAQGTNPFSNRTGLAWLMLGRVMARQGNDAQASGAFQAAVINLSNTVDANHPKLLMARALFAG